MMTTHLPANAAASITAHFGCSAFAQPAIGQLGIDPHAEGAARKLGKTNLLQQLKSDKLGDGGAEKVRCVSLTARSQNFLS
jgi:hypothetical protein